MNALERDIIEKFHQLDPEARQRVRQVIQNDSMIVKVGDDPFDFEAWMAEVEANRIQLRTANGEPISASDLLDEVREERDADILRSIGFGGSAGDRAD